MLFILNQIVNRYNFRYKQYYARNLLTKFQVKYNVLYIYRHICEATSVLCKRVVSNTIKCYQGNGCLSVDLQTSVSQPILYHRTAIYLKLSPAYIKIIQDRYVFIFIINLILQSNVQLFTNLKV
jgi:hypothetical protein